MPVGHLLPHEPQLSSVEIETQRPLHQRAEPLVQTQAPATQVLRPRPQALPQLPQFSGSIERFVHLPWHSSWPGGQMHCPLTQAAPPTQRVPQPPQCSGSLAVSVQLPSQAVAPVGQDATQALCEQSSAGPHSPWQLPAHAAPLSQTHLPWSQCEPTPQATPQPPQWLFSLSGSMQRVGAPAALQAMVPDGQEHLPATHLPPTR